MSRFYELKDDRRSRTRWHLGAPVNERGEELDPGSFAKASHWLSKECSVFRSALRVIRCIEDARCTEVRYWKPEDGEPEKVGEYRSVIGLRINLSSWRIALIVSEEAKDAIRRGDRSVDEVQGVRVG